MSGSPFEMALADIETLLREVRSFGEWSDDDETILARWRGWRGEAGMTEWRWWWKLPDDDLYRTDHPSRNEAFAMAIAEEPGAAVVELIDARSWNDDITAGDQDTEWFAESRNHEIVRIRAND